MNKHHKRYYFVLFSRVMEISAAILFSYWVYASIMMGEAWYFTLIYGIAVGTNIWSFYMGMRRNVVQFVYRRIRECPNCDSREYFIVDTLDFRTSSRIQCAIVHCAQCNLSTVFSCKCTPDRCEFRVDCLAIPTVRVPFLYPRKWVGLEIDED